MFHIFIPYALPIFGVELFAEEIFAKPEAIWTSDDGARILFASFNDTLVGQLTYPWFDSSSLTSARSPDTEFSFPEMRSIRYPTPGTKNPEVQLWILDVLNASTIQQWPVTPPVTMDGQ